MDPAEISINPSSVFKPQTPLPFGVQGISVTSEQAMTFTKGMSSQFTPLEVKGLI